MFLFWFLNFLLFQLFHCFLINLNCKIISNKEKELTIRDKICYPYQIYINDINVLSEICDYILIPEIYNYGINNNVCPYLKEILTDKITKRQILRYKIKYTSLIFEITSLFIIGLKLTKNIIKIIYSYIYAKRKQINYNNNQENYQRHLIDKEQKKILIMSYFYILEDIKEEIISILKKYNIIPLFSNYLNKKEAYKFSQYYKEELGNIYVKEMVGAYYYYQYIVSGVIYISPNNLYILSVESFIFKQIKAISFSIISSIITSSSLL